MKLDKKVIESGIVAALALVTVSSTALNPNNVTLTPQYTQISEVETIPVSINNNYSTIAGITKTLTTLTIDTNSTNYLKSESGKLLLKEEFAKAVKRDLNKTVKEVASNHADAAKETNETEEAVDDVERDEIIIDEQQDEAFTADKIEQQGEKAPEIAEQAEETVDDFTEAAEQAEETAVAVAEEESSEWDEKLMPSVDEYLNVRAEANEEAKVVGKLYKGADATILETGEEWSKISSGNVEGYVKNEYCVFDDDAQQLATELGTTYATALTGGLRVRAEANQGEETKILDVLEEGKKIKVDTAAETEDGWIPVVVDETEAYVSAEFVTVELELGKGITIEEELQAQRAAEEERARKAAEETASAGKSTSSTTNHSAAAASHDDITLLGALIQCEAGSESYEGQLAVGAVVMNRLRRGYAGSISAVIYQSGQFTPASSGALANRLAKGVSGSCLSAAQEAINGVDNVGGATSFRSARSGRAGIVIGNHVFF